jgi:elongation factor G
MEEDHPKRRTQPTGNRPPPRPPRKTTIGLGPDDDSDKKGRITITKAADGEGKFIRQSGGADHYGHVIIRIEPNGRGKGITISKDAAAGTVPQEHLHSVTDGIRMILDHGDADGRPIVDVIVRIIGGSSHKSNSTELAFQMAGIFAMKDALKKAHPILIE